MVGVVPYPITDPWDERDEFTDPYGILLTFYDFHVGKYTVHPMDPIGMDDPIPMFSYDLLYLSEFPQVAMWFGDLTVF